MFFFDSRAIAQPGEDAPPPETLKSLSLEELTDVQVVSVSRHSEKLSETASAIRVITREDIRRSGASSLPEALRLADNLDVAQRNSHDWAITARGFNTALANKLLVMIDGRTVYTPLFSGVFWDVQNYPLEDIERIEVISGPGGTLWGANAVNGVINIITRSAKDTQGSYVRVAAGSRLEDSAAARIGGMIAPGVYMRVYGQTFDRSGEVRADGSPAGDGWRQDQAGFRIDSEASPRDRLTVHGDLYQGDEHVVTGGAAEVSGGNLLARWSHAVSDHAGMSLQVYYDRTHLVDPVPAFVLGSVEFAPAGFLTDDLDTFDVDFQQRLRAGERNGWIWGLGYRHTRDMVENAPGLAFLPTVLEQDLFSGFLQDAVTLRDDLLFTFGTKLEHNDYTGFEVEPGMRLQWTLAPDQSLWAAISRAVRTPSRIDRDLSQPAPDQALVILEGSSGFTSESVVASELGYRAQIGDRVAVAVSGFYNDYRDIRSTSATPDTLLPFFFENNLEGETHGIELSVDYQVSDWWRLRGSYDPLREHIRVKPGHQDINDAHNETADPALRWALRSSMDLAHRVELDAGLRHVGARDINSGPTVGVVAGYTELDLRLGWHPSDRLELSIVGQNLLHDRHAEYGFPDASQIQSARSVYGRIVWQF
ncbi:MAG TPA: TonB-dependent receptor [Rhodanobacteraceae bacterium]|nr:TonB-dependent receptor [Rhodanobacteraceae bacterium]